jgi:aarF domain-containing kinase
VPDVVDTLSTKRVLVTDLVSGVPVDRCVTAPQETRNWVRAALS